MRTELDQSMENDVPAPVPIFGGSCPGGTFRSCHVSQPSLSSGIKQLELELGVPIFLRGRGQRFHGLTPEGEHVARWARQVISDCSAMRDEIDLMQNNLRGNLRVGSMPSMSP